MTEKAIKTLEDEFLRGSTKVEACLVAGISRDSLADYERDHPGYKERIEELREWPKIQARRNIAEAIDNGDAETSKWYLARKAKDEFSPRVESTGADGEALLGGLVAAIQNRTSGLPKDDTEES